MGLFNEISPFGRNDNGIVIPSMTPAGPPGLLGLPGRAAWPTGRWASFLRRSNPESAKGCDVAISVHATPVMNKSYFGENEWKYM